jgi:NAD(P)H-dependent FMN reductase
MSEIVIFSCTNRAESNTLKVSKIYERLLSEKQVATRLLDFRRLPDNITAAELFGKRTEKYAELVKEFVITQNKFIFIVPEYNGSFPGILKTFLESMHPREWANKKACIVGVSDGRAGNLRGMDHLTGVLQYLKMHVFYNKLPISQVEKVMTSDGSFIESQLKVCKAQVDGFLEF